MKRARQKERAREKKRREEKRQTIKAEADTLLFRFVEEDSRVATDDQPLIFGQSRAVDFAAALGIQHTLENIEREKRMTREQRRTEERKREARASRTLG
jgi:hypothetical protein